MSAAPAPEPALSRQAIIAAALSVVEQESMAALTMRRVAREMGRAPMSLYRHVADLDELLGLVVDDLVSEVDLVDHGEDWRRTLREGARRMRQVLLRYPGIVGVVMANGIRTEGMLRTLDVVMGALLTAGLSPQQAVRAHRAVFATIFGDSVMQRAGEEALQPSDPSEFLSQLAEVGSGRYHNLATVGRTWRHVDPDQAFEFTMDLLLDGIATLAGER